MHILTASLAILSVVSLAQQGFAAQSSGDYYPDHNACQGISPIAHKTYRPLKHARLQKVSVMMRHGDRVPASMLQGDSTSYRLCNNPLETTSVSSPPGVYHGSPSYASPSMRNKIVASPEENLYAAAGAAYYWPNSNCEIGQLTDRGAAQTRVVGERLREIYVDLLHFLPHDLPKNPDDALYFRNTNVPRTKISAANAFEGLYPERFRKGKQAVSLVTFPQSIETLTLNPVACPKLGAIYQGFVRSPVYAAHIKENAALMVKANTVLGVALDPRYNTTLQGDQVLPRLCNKLSLCQATNPKNCISPQEAQTLMEKSTFLYSGFLRVDVPGAGSSEIAKRLAVGPFLKNIADSIRGTLASDKNGHHKVYRPFELYSAHDQSLDQVLSVVAEPNTPWPAYASTVIFELWQKKNGKSVVRLLHEGRVVPANKNLKCVLDACPVEVFLQFIESYVPKNIVAECAL
ncbi:Acid phosphatase-like protein 2 [Mortierella antarctica]|nr:Acid phosphatase-like protein 2 [Mortierella antarctica]